MKQKSLSVSRFFNLSKISFGRKSGILWTAFLLALSFCAVTALAVRTSKSDGAADVSATEPLTSAMTNAKAPNAVKPVQVAIPVSAELLILTPEGFVPDHITRSAGPFLLTVADRSGLDQAALQLNTQGGATLRSTLSTIQKAEAQEVFDLQPGTYLFTEANHPNLVCEITITP
jgi:hypothetical protein